MELKMGEEGEGRGIEAILPLFISSLLFRVEKLEARPRFQPHSFP
jgi:hypothetical protein